MAGKKTKKPGLAKLKALQEVRNLTKCTKSHCKDELKKVDEVGKIAGKSMKYCEKKHRMPAKCKKNPLGDMECSKAMLKRIECFDRREGLTPSEKKVSKTLMTKILALSDCQKKHCEPEQEKMFKAMQKFFKQKQRAKK